MKLAQAADFAGLLAWRRFASRERNSQPAGLQPSRSQKLQWRASKKFALQSRGGDGFAPSSRARSPRLMWRGWARC